MKFLWDLTEDFNILTSGDNINVLRKISLSTSIVHLHEIQSGSTLTGAPNQVGWGKIGDFRQITGCMSKTVQDRCTVDVQREIFNYTLILAPLVRILKSSVKIPS